MLLQRLSAGANFRFPKFAPAVILDLSRHLRVWFHLRAVVLVGQGGAIARLQSDSTLRELWSGESRGQCGFVGT